MQNPVRDEEGARIMRSKLANLGALGSSKSRLGAREAIVKGWAWKTYRGKEREGIVR